MTPSLSQLRKYYAIVAVNFRSERIYFANWLASSAAIGLRIWILAQLYRATYASMNLTEANGLSIAELVWILALTQCFGRMTSGSTDRIISEDVSSGNIAYHLTRPISYILLQYFTYWGKGLAFLGESILAGGVVTYILVGGLELSLESVFSGCILLFLGSTLHFLLSMVIGLIAFWTEDTSAFWWIYHKAYIILGGMIIPPQLLPSFWRDVAEALPFSQLFYSAAKSVSAFDPQFFINSLLRQGLWIGALTLVVHLMFSRGSTRVAVNGG